MNILTMWVRNHSLKYKELNIYCVERCCKKTGVVVDKGWNDTYFGEAESEKRWSPMNSRPLKKYLNRL